MRTLVRWFCWLIVWGAWTYVAYYLLWANTVVPDTKEVTICSDGWGYTYTEPSEVWL